MTETYLGLAIPALPDSLIPLTKPDLEHFPNRTDYAAFILTDNLNQAIAELRPEVKLAGLSLTYAATQIDADYALACHPLAKTLKLNPQQIAQGIALELAGSKPAIIQQIEAQNGYVNITVDAAAFGNSVLQNIEALGDQYGHINLGDGSTVIIDCSSPNVAKFMSVGHLRSTIIGESLARIYRATGHMVIRDNHLGDWGTQFGMLARAYELWGEDYEELRENINPIQGLYKLYVRIHEESERERNLEAGREGITDPKEKGKIQTSLEKEGRRWFQRLEAHDEQALELLKWATEQSLTEFQRVYDLLGSRYEYILGESFYISMLPAVLQYLKERRISTADDKGAMIVDLKDRKLNRLVVQKSDETSLYATRDLATLVARTAWFNPQKILYVVGADQKEYFQQVFATFDKMTNGTGPELEHISFGLITLPEGKMSTRSGRVVFLEEVLNEAIARAKNKTDEVSKNVPEDQRQTIAKQVGVGAVVFFDLGQGRERNIQFDWDKALSFDGYAAPYIQYAHARTRALLRRAQEEKVEIRTDIPPRFDLKEERDLIKHLGNYPAAIVRAVQINGPHILAEYVYKAADLFSKFYNEVSVFNEPDQNLRNTRLRLAQDTALVIRNGLDLLCIEAPERM